MASVSLPFVLLALLVAGGESSREAPSSTAFSLHFFAGSGEAASQVVLYGGAAANASSTGMAIAGAGRVAYKKPITFVGRTPGFSTYFSFSLSGRAPALAFFLTPGTARIGSPAPAAAGGRRADLPPSVVAVVFAAEPTTQNATSSHIEIDVAGEMVIKTGDVGSRGVAVAGGSKLHSWIDYNGTTSNLQVRLAKTSAPKPAAALLSYPIDLSTILWRKPMVVGLSSWEAQNCSLFSWAFKAIHGPPYLMHSEPLDPSAFMVTPQATPAPARAPYPWGFLMSLVFAAACGAMLTFFTLFVWFAVVARRPVAPVEYPVHPSDVVYEKIVLVGVKDDAAAGSK